MKDEDITWELIVAEAHKQPDDDPIKAIFIQVAEHIATQAATIEALREAARDVARHIQEQEQKLREIIEIYAGMEGFEPDTAPEGYCLRIIKQMYNAALGVDDDL